MRLAARGSLLVSLAAGAAGAAELPQAGPWLKATPETPGEAALVDAVVRGPFAGKDGNVRLLERVAEQHPGTAAAGLARLSAGLLLLESEEPQAALRLLRHPDIQETRVHDRALLAIGQALEQTGDAAGAAATYLAAVDVPGSSLVCAALQKSAEAYLAAELAPRAIASLNRALVTCPGDEPRILARLAEALESVGERRAAAEALDRLDHEFPASPEAGRSAARRAALSRHLPSVPAELRVRRDLAKGLALFEAGQRARAIAALRPLVGAKTLEANERDLVRVRLGRALSALRKRREARRILATVPGTSPYAAEAAYHLALLSPSRGRVAALETVARRHAGTTWGEQALFALGNRFQKDMLFDRALPYYRRLLAEYPDGEQLERTAWYVGLADYRAGRHQQAATRLEGVARQRPDSGYVGAFLYWAARSRLAMGETGRATSLLQETVRRFKRSYYGWQAAAALGRQRPPATSTPPPSAPGPVDGEISEPRRTRVRELMLIGRFEAARDELRGLAPSPRVSATAAWLEYRAGRFRPAITVMTRAFPDWVGEGGDGLPEGVFKILFPLEHADLLRAAASRQGLDAALVAALIRQESSFDDGAISRAGARGLMQLMPATARSLLRSLGRRYRRGALHDPATNLELGTVYLRRMLDHFGGRVERALAAYNAGPHRVDRWTAGRPDVPAEEFIETIPFSETRTYVKIVLGATEEYRRLYSLGERAANPTGTGR
jgi:soluble lytic murein transglycosylase